MRNFNSRSLLGYLLIISIFLFISVVGFNFVANATSFLASVTSISLSSPTDTWPAGATKTITIGHSDFATWSFIPDPNEYRTFYVWLCHPTTNYCTQFGWPLDTLNVSGRGAINISRTVGSDVYNRLTAGDSVLTPYYNGYQTKLKICPSTLAGSASSYGCRYSSNFSIAPSSASVSSISSVTIVTTPTNTWTAGATKTIRVNYLNFSGDTKTVQVNMCNPDTNLCGVINTPSLNLTGNNQTTISQTIGSQVYADLVAGVSTITPYYSSSTVNGVKTYYGKLKICPATLTGVVPTGAGCSESSTFSIANPNTGSPSVSAVSIEGISSGWPISSTKKINFNFAAFSGQVKTVKASLCNPLTRVCLDFSLGESLNLINNGSSGLSVTLPNVDPTSSLYVRNGYSNVKVCPLADNGAITSAGCAYSSNFQVLAEIQSPNIDVAYVTGIISGWPAGATKTVTVGYKNFSGDTKTVQVNMCNPDTNLCGVINTPSLNLTGNNQTTISQTIGSQVYADLVAGVSTITPYYSSSTVNGVKTYYGKLKICPATLTGVVPTGAICRETPKFKVIAPPSSGGSGGSSGQGCLTGECVCVNGTRMKCGRPMQPGTGCAVPIGCTAYPTKATAPRPPKMLLPRLFGASLSFISDNLINLFLK